MIIRTTINGAPRELSCEDPRTSLLDVLRGAGYKSVKAGCREGACGACTVLVDGKPRHSCQMPAVLAEGRELTTIEGLGAVDRPHPLQSAFVEVGAVQCGYCTPGAILSAKALLDQEPDPSRQEVVEALDGNLCRCTGYVKMLDAVLLAARQMREESR